MKNHAKKVGKKTIQMHDELHKGPVKGTKKKPSKKKG